MLKGGAVFLADLIRRMDIDLEIDFLSLSSYGNATTSSGKVHLVHDLRANLEGRHVVLVEGVVDTGHSVRFLLDLLSQRHPASLKVCRCSTRCRAGTFRCRSTTSGSRSATSS